MLSWFAIALVDRRMIYLACYRPLNTRSRADSLNKTRLIWTGIKTASSILFCKKQIPPEALELRLAMTLINVSNALEALGGDRNLLVELAKMFSEDAPIALKTLRVALKSENSNSVLSEVHLLKGLVATFFAKPVVDQAQRLEEAAAVGSLEPFRNGGYNELQQNIEAIILDFQSLGWVDPR